jgi:hypothetical protein
MLSAISQITRGVANDGVDAYTNDNCDATVPLHRVQARVVESPRQL